MRSKGVTILAWSMIVVNLYALLSLLFFRGTFFHVYKSFPKYCSPLIILGSILLAAIGVVSGSGILKLKDNMRKAGIAVNSLDLFFGLPLFFLSLKDIREYTRYIAVSDLSTPAVHLTVNKLADLGFQVAVIAVLASFAFNLIFIFFFTRPAVKGQFK